MKRRLFAVFCLAWTFACTSDHLPPYTAQKAARVITHLAIPDDAAVEEWEDGEPGMFSFASGGFSRIRLRLDSTSFESITQQARAAGFRQLPVAEAGRFPNLKAYAAPNTRGLYETWIDTSKNAYRTVVLDATTRRVLIQRGY